MEGAPDIIYFLFYFNMLDQVCRTAPGTGGLSCSRRVLTISDNFCHSGHAERSLGVHRSRLRARNGQSLPGRNPLHSSLRPDNFLARTAMRHCRRFAQAAAAVKNVQKS